MMLEEVANDFEVTEWEAEILVQEIEDVMLANAEEAQAHEWRAVELDEEFWAQNSFAYDVEVIDADDHQSMFDMDTLQVNTVYDFVEYWGEWTEDQSDYFNRLFSDSYDDDSDGLTNLSELYAGTDPYNKDSDGDGWADGPSNIRYQLRLETVSRSDHYSFWDTAYCTGEDEIYFIVDDARWPKAGATYGNSAINGFWELDDDETIWPNTIVEERVMPMNGPTRMRSKISIWDDDAEHDLKVDDWYEDDHYFSFEVDLLKADSNGQIKVVLKNKCARFDVTFKVEQTKFADPIPMDYGFYDTDGDGLQDFNESFLASVFEGMADPEKQDIWVEVDRASDVGSGWRDHARHMVVSQFERHNINLRIDDGRFGGGTVIPHSGKLSAHNWGTYRNQHFTSWRKGLFRYAIIADEIYTKRSGVADGDSFLVDGNRFFYNKSSLTQSGTFMHELGHSLGLTKGRFPNSYIDKDSLSRESMDYYSCLNYLYQYTLVDYS
ncbi:MAG: hypothetical protein HN348_32310, partial [Proteobacteria bacterium]|nr:hypothetical protein [Pseudomonadota bacterium]